MELPFFRSYRIEVPEMATFSLSQENWGLKYELNYETWKRCFFLGENKTHWKTRYRTSVFERLLGIFWASLCCQLPSMESKRWRIMVGPCFVAPILDYLGEFQDMFFVYENTATRLQVTCSDSFWIYRTSWDCETNCQWGTNCKMGGSLKNKSRLSQDYNNLFVETSSIHRSTQLGKFPQLVSSTVELLLTRKK